MQPEVKEEVQKEETVTTVNEEVETVEEAAETVDESQTEEVVEGEEEVSEEEAEEKVRESEKRFNPPPWQQAPVQTQPTERTVFQPQPPPQQIWYEDDQLEAYREQHPDDPKVDRFINDHKIKREAHRAADNVQRNLTEGYYATQEWNRLVSRYPQLENPNSKLHKAYRKHIDNDPDFLNRPKGYVYAAKMAIADMQEGQLIQAKNNGRREVLRERKIMDQVIIEKQTPPMKQTASKKPGLSAQEKAMAQSAGLTDEQWIRARDKLAARGGR